MHVPEFEGGREDAPAHSLDKGEAAASIGAFIEEVYNPPEADPRFTRLWRAGQETADKGVLILTP
jgi:hypothetical protein